MKKLSYLFVLCALIALSARTTRADAVPEDPRIGAGGGGSCGFVDLTSANQSFTLNSGEFNVPCIVDFKNDTGSILSTLTVAIGNSFSGLLTCGLDPGTPFSSTLQPPQTAANTCEFLGASVPNGNIFGLTFGSSIHPFCLNDSTGACQPLTSLTGTATPNPEPASLALIGTGLAALIARRKKLGNAQPVS